MEEKGEEGRTDSATFVAYSDGQDARNYSYGDDDFGEVLLAQV